MYDFKYCTVIDPGLIYPVYEEWLMKYFKEYKCDWLGEKHSQVLPDRLYQIMGRAPHGEEETDLYLIRDMDTEEVFIIGEDGIVKTTLPIEIRTMEAVVNKYKIRKGDNNMNNEVLNLWKKRKQDDINKKYNDIVTKEYESLEVRKEYKELIEKFEKDLDALVLKYNTNADIHDLPFIKTGYEPEYGIELNDGIRYSIAKKYEEEQNKEFSELMDLVEEIKAQLSLSDDKDYQIDVLTRYDVLKKGKLNI